MKFGFGIDLGGTTVKIAYFDEEGSLLDKWEIPTVTADGGSAILPDIAASVNSYLESKQISKDQIIGIGIGVPGPVDNEGTVNKCVNLGWGVINIPKILGGLTRLAVTAGNDANVAALGEAWKGGGQGCKNMVFATLGTGVGGGIVIGGEVVHGVHGAGGGIVRIAQQFLSTSDAESALRDIHPLTCKDVFDAAKAGDYLANQALDKVYQYMGQFLAMICCTVDPEVVVLGGGVSKAGQTLIDGAKRYFDQYIFHASRGIRFALASLGNDAGAYGAFKLALNAAK